MKQKGKRFYLKENENSDSKIINADFTAHSKNQKNVDSADSADNVDTKPMSKKEKRKLIKEDKKALRDKAKSSGKVKKSLPDKSEKSNLKGSKPKTPIKTGEGDEKFSFKGLIDALSDLLESIKINKKSVVLSSVILLILLICVLAVANRDRLSFSNIKNWVQYGVFNMESDEKFPVSTQGDVINNGNFMHIDSNLAYLSDTQFVTMNNYGKVIYNTKQNYSKPVLVNAADCDLSIAYNLGSTDFTINTLDSTVYSSKAEDDIFAGDICKDGTYALVTKKDGYLSKLYVYNNNNEQIYAYSFADYYITSVSLNNNGTKAVVTGVSAHDATPISVVYLLDFTKKEPLFFEELKDNVLYYCDHLNNNYVCIIGENACYTLNSLTKEYTTTNYDGKSLSCFDVNTDTNTFTLSLSRSGEGRMCDLFSFSTSGVLKDIVSTDLKITSLSTYKNRIAALSEGTIYLYTKDGNLLSQKDAGLDPNCVVLYSKSDAYVLGVSEIRRLDL